MNNYFVSLLRILSQLFPIVLKLPNLHLSMVLCFNERKRGQLMTLSDYSSVYLCQTLLSMPLISIRGSLF
jgi:hypothetical protein